MPEWAATVAGSDFKAMGSRMATFAGFNDACRIDIFRPRSVSVMTQDPDTSDPVPAVVGIAISGKGGIENFSMPSYW